MSISGVGSLAGQVAQEATVSLCGRFVNLFQYRIAAVAAIALTSFGGMIVGLFAGAAILDKLGEKGTLILIIATPIMTALNVMVAKCLKLPFSPLVTAGVAAGAGVLTLVALAMAYD
jgi:hypothetical protein